jgi:hypothetical protein
LDRGPKANEKIEKERDWLDYRWTERQIQCRKDSELEEMNRSEKERI